MNSDAPASTWMPWPPQWPAVTLITDLHSLISSSVGASAYSVSALSKLFKAMRYLGNNICSDK